MPDSEKPLEKSGGEKKPFNKRRRFRKGRFDKNSGSGERPSGEASGSSAAAPSPSAAAPIKARPQDRQDRRDRQPRDHKHRSHKSGSWEKAPAWEPEDFLKAQALPESQEDLRKILADVDPEELMMAPLFQKRKYTNQPASEEEELIPEELQIEGSPKVVIDVVKTCPICDKPIREVMYALHDYEHDRLAHFDCVFRKVSESLEEKLTDNRYLAYLGSGAFGIMESFPNKPNKSRLVEKIYPGAPVEELLHAEENQPDEEL